MNIPHTPGPQWYPEPVQQSRQGHRLAWAISLSAVLFAVAVVAFVGFVAPGWFNRDTVDASIAEADIRAAIPLLVGAFSDIACPDDEPAEIGHRFTCTVRAPGLQRTMTVIVVEGDNRPYAIEIVRNKVLNARGVEQGVVDILGEEASVDDVSCPEDQKVEKDHTFTCTATINGEQKKVPITVVDAESDPPQYRVDQPE